MGENVLKLLLTPFQYAGCEDKKHFYQLPIWKDEHCNVTQSGQKQKTSFPLKKKISDLWKGQQY